jgi:hypothetical protein
MKFITNVLLVILTIASTTFSFNNQSACSDGGIIIPQNNCISFSIGSGTGCAWMCSYCANTLGTNNYYFTTDVCTYQSGGCVGSPQTGVTYTCCSV